jgi:hypothetical protein
MLLSDARPATHEGDGTSFTACSAVGGGELVAREPRALAEPVVNATRRDPWL